MRWDDLFADLGAQWDAEARRELDAEVADRTRRERALVGLLRAAGGRRRRAWSDGALRTGTAVSGRVADVGDGWLLLGGGGGGSGAGAVRGGHGREPGSRRGPAGTALGRRFGLGYALRGLSRDRAVVLLTDLDGAVVTGTIDAVGRDVLELSEHAADLPRRAENVTGRRLVPFSAVVLLRPA